MSIPFSIFSGAGNTFVLVDNRENFFDAKHAPSICHHCDVDGLILAEKGVSLPIAMRLFNRDGTGASMSGNGFRCLVQFLKELSIDQDTYPIETPVGIHSGFFTKNGIGVRLPPPKNIKWNISIPLNESVISAHYLNTGVPHVVIFVDKLESIDVVTLGKKIRFHPLFEPLGANVNFVSHTPPAMRTYERGVENETLACGTGAIAVALALAKFYDSFSPVSIAVRSGEKLTVSFTPDWSRLTLEGSVNKISSGTFNPKYHTIPS